MFEINWQQRPAAAVSRAAVRRTVRWAGVIGAIEEKVTGLEPVICQGQRVLGRIDSRHRIEAFGFQIICEAMHARDCGSAECDGCQ